MQLRNVGCAGRITAVLKSVTTTLQLGTRLFTAVNNLRCIPRSLSTMSGINVFPPTTSKISVSYKNFPDVLTKTFEYPTRRKKENDVSKAAFPSALARALLYCSVILECHV